MLWKALCYTDLRCCSLNIACVFPLSVSSLPIIAWDTQEGLRLPPPHLLWNDWQTCHKLAHPNLFHVLIAIWTSLKCLYSARWYFLTSSLPRAAPHGAPGAWDGKSHQWRPSGVQPGFCISLVLKGTHDLQKSQEHLKAFHPWTVVGYAFLFNSGPSYLWFQMMLWLESCWD